MNREHPLDYDEQPFCRTDGEPVIVELLGGLGNQMFQYALGRSLSVRIGAPLLLDTHLLLDWRPGRHHVNRPFGLGIFALAHRLATRADIARYHAHGGSTANKIMAKLRRSLLGIDRVTRERSYRYDASILARQPPVFLSGLWQSYKYFSSIEETIRQDFVFREELPSEMEAVCRDIRMSGSVCVHVRRGDYISVPESAAVLGFVGEGYFSRALDLVRGMQPVSRLFVFSDDPDWCESTMTGYCPEVMVMRSSARYGTQAARIDMQLMAQSRCTIISNSTFAWWSAWLAGKECRVLWPENWFRSSALSTDDLIPPGWIKV